MTIKTISDLLSSSIRHNVENDHELDKVDITVVVGIVNPENMFLHFAGVFLRHGLRHHLPEVRRLHLPVGMLRDESLKGPLNICRLHPTRFGQSLNVLVPEDRLAVLGSHGGELFSVTATLRSECDFNAG